VSPASARGKAPGQRLHDTAPRLYSVTAPSARAVRRAWRLMRGWLEARAFERSLVAWPPVPPTAADPSVLLDGVAFQDPWTGVARVWREVMPEWSKSEFARHVVVVDRGGTAPRHAGFTYVEAPSVREYDSPSQCAMLQATFDALGATVYVSTLYSTAISAPTLQVVYDLVPETLGWNLREPMWREKAHAIASATAFACISASTARDLHHFYPHSASRPSVVTPLGVSAAFQPSSDEQVERFRAAHDLPTKYFVFVGHRSIHKNAELVFDAASLAGDTADFGLVFVGGSPDLEPRFHTTSGHVDVRIVRLSDEELRAAYTGARALLYPSRYEGFGLTMLEAMACGCPVITCRNSALPEMAGDAALYVGEDDPAGMLDAMKRVTDAAARAELVAKGLARAAGYSWKRTAAALEAAIRDVAP
jgi:glycosyltransferase involved in cell wall biosynthesis